MTSFISTDEFEHVLCTRHSLVRLLDGGQWGWEFFSHFFCEVVSKNMHRVQMFLLELFLLEHASYELQNTAGQKQPLKDIEKRKKTAEGGREKNSSPLQQSCSHCAKPSRVRYQFTLKLCLEKSTWPPSPRVSLSHTHTFTLLTYIIAYYHLNCCVFLFCCHRALDTLIPLFLSCTLSIFSHTYLHYVCLPLSSHWELVQIPWRGSSVEHSCS